MRNVLWLLGAAASCTMSLAFVGVPLRATTLAAGGRPSGSYCATVAQRPVAIARVAATTRVAAFTALEAKKKGKGGGNNDGAQPRERKEKDDVIEWLDLGVALFAFALAFYQIEGVVKEGLPSAMFRVEVGATGKVVLCTISGRIRKNFVRILVGDPVRVELSPYDLTRGRITFRYNNFAGGHTSTFRYLEK
eukprot:jgi/Undpi1/4981/HiC_scaffold_19.g08333.m1